jgi:phospholipid transport system substrate-binding protein
MRKWIAFAVLAFTTAAGGQEVPPDQLVKGVMLEIQAIIAQDKDLQGGDRSKTIALIEQKALPHFNFVGMTALAVGPAWQKATPEQKKRLAEEFRILLTRTYASSLSSFGDQKLDFRPLRMKPADTDVTVVVRVLQQGGQPIAVEYDMEKTARGWKCYDVRVAGISLVVNYRTEFANLVREGGIDGLVKALDTKNRAAEGPAAAPAKK